MSQLSVLRSEGPITAKEVMEGATPTSNWVVPNLIAIGETPRAGDSVEMLLDYGVECFVDLSVQANGREGVESSPYLSASTIELPETLTYHGYDLSAMINAPTTQTVNDAARFLATVLVRALQGEGRPTYIHCPDGGQTSAVAGVAALAFVYQLTALKATTVIAQQYACRSAVAVQGGLFNTHLKMVCRELVAAIPAAVERYEKEAPPPQPKPEAAPAAAGPGPSRDDDDDGAHHANHNDGAPATDLPRAPAANPHDRYAAFAQPSQTPDHQRQMPQPAATPDRPDQQQQQQQQPYYEPYQPPLSSQQQRAPQDDHQRFQQQQQQQQYQPQQQEEKRSPPRARPQQLAAEQLDVEGYARPESRPTPSGGGPSQAATPSRDDQRRGSRFAHTRGHGGGASQINLFGGGPEASVETPNRRGGRARVQHSPEQSPSASLAESRSQASTPACIPRPQSAAALSAASTPSAQVSPSAPATSGSSGLPTPLEPRRSPAAVAGPTATSNWVVAGRVAVGAKPVRGQVRPFAALAAERFNAFVCLTEADASPEFLGALAEQGGVDPATIATRHFPIKDGQMVKGPATRAFLDLVEEVARRVEEGAWRVYVYCARGHGRSGLFVTALLWRLYGLPPMKAMNYCDALHACRQVTEDQSSPQTQDQRTGIVALLSAADKELGRGPK